MVSPPGGLQVTGGAQPGARLPLRSALFHAPPEPRGSASVRAPPRACASARAWQVGNSRSRRRPCTRARCPQTAAAAAPSAREGCRLQAPPPLHAPPTPARRALPAAPSRSRS
ncbi:hypothetical protein PVAP13_3NG211301 [Panicum virgatum]|uniref:Uncharacterized protein n=1 Tax=Panicum virgatum TaxID=38727 RepID=A0A8T0U3A0_PANVG|nr:hypothetical protein PVAP13_3NG211301 [Panicum virgatum]